MCHFSVYPLNFEWVIWVETSLYQHAVTYVTVTKGLWENNGKHTQSWRCTRYWICTVDKHEFV